MNTEINLRELRDFYTLKIKEYYYSKKKKTELKKINVNHYKQLYKIGKYGSNGVRLEYLQELYFNIKEL